METVKMKKDIHPPFQKAIVHCACGNEFETFSTVKEINVEICSQCHPFFTGQQKIVDSTGRVERFRRKYEKSMNQVGRQKAKKDKHE